jgi:putative acetyltransferase
MDPMLIRRETAADEDAVTAVTAEAFRSPDNDPPVEVGLLAGLRQDAGWIPELSLVAVAGDEVVVGHVVCTRATVGGRPVLGLGPVSVLPDRQRQGTGQALVHAVLGAADALGEPLVGLLGDPAYYARFAFRPAAELGIEAPEASWGRYFQARPLTAYGPDQQGAFVYAAPFQEL